MTANLESWIACASDVPAGNFAAIVRDCWPSLCDEGVRASAWLEDPLRPDGLKLCDAALGDDEGGGVSSAVAQSLIDAWPEGRLFGDHGELRWETRPDGTLDLVLTSDRPGDQQLPDGFEAPVQIEWLGNQALLLWGERRNGPWSEGRIPHLPYPGGWKGPYAAIRSRDYRLPESADRPYESRITRFRSFDGTYSI